MMSSGNSQWGHFALISELTSASPLTLKLSCMHRREPIRLTQYLVLSVDAFSGD